MSRIFISYAWENGEPAQSVLKLTASLRELGYDAGIDVIKTGQETAASFPKMMAECLMEADKVIIVLSERYKKKADSFNDGVGTEYSYIINNIGSKEDKYILISFDGVEKNILDKICPDFIRGREVVDLSTWNQASTEDLKSERFKTFFLKLNGKPPYEFPEVNKEKYVPSPWKIADNSVDNDKVEENQSDSVIAKEDNNFTDSSAFFEYRLSKAYPGIRGIRIIDVPEAATSFLERLLCMPLAIRNSDDPIWYFRGNSCYYIEDFEKIAPATCLIDASEYKIKKVAIYHGYEYWRDFVYLESEPEEPCGLFDYPEGADFNKRAKELGIPYCYEEYAVFTDNEGKERILTREEYDDGGTVINGEVVDTVGKAKLRIRYLTPYNIVICAKDHPFNSKRGDELTEKYLNGILNQEYTIADFVNASMILRKNEP